MDTKEQHVWTGEPHEFLSEVNFVPRKVSNINIVGTRRIISYAAPLLGDVH